MTKTDGLLPSQKIRSSDRQATDDGIIPSADDTGRIILFRPVLSFDGRSPGLDRGIGERSRGIPADRKSG